jgi:hypothetical protein
MSLKDTYRRQLENLQNISNKSEEQIAAEVESVGYHEQDIIKEERFIPRTDYSRPSAFARYGSATEYYQQSIKRVYSTYPYDGSLKERLEWENDSNYLDLYLFEQRYPRTNGYVILSADGWGTQTATTGGYGMPSSQEYISFIGGPNVNPGGMSPIALQFTGSNYWDPDKNRVSNLQFDLENNGATVEFWLKKDSFDASLTEKEVVFDLWNNELSSSDSYGRFRLELSSSTTPGGEGPLLLTVMSGATGFQWEPVVVGSAFTTASIADGNWHHYAVTVKSASAGVLTKFYVDGALHAENTLGVAGINNIGGALKGHIGALIIGPSGTVGPGTPEESAFAWTGAGKLSASMDEFRYWKTQRSSKDIGRYWISQVGGGTNTDPAPDSHETNLVNTDLGVYFKFNEGITGVESADSTVLDYAGRVSNGAWTGYGENSRNTDSAIVISKAAVKEFKDPIIYSFHPEVVSLKTQLEATGSYHDVRNNTSIYNSIPGWVQEEDDESAGELRKLTQILASYFDTLQLQIDSVNSLKDVVYYGDSQKPLPFANKLLESMGLMTPEMFLDADVLEKLADRSEKHLYEKSLNDIKNTIYQNIYNNLTYIYKSKGTEKAFRNLIRCYGIDDELIKLSLYANNIEYELLDNSRNVVTSKRFVNFNTKDNLGATIYQSSASSDANSVAFIAGSTNLTGGFAFTTEVDVLFPRKAPPGQENYIDTNFITASVFGIHGDASGSEDTTWATPDAVNFQVFAVRDELRSPNVRFVLTGTAGGFMPPTLVSDLYEDTYNNTKWNLAVRIKPEKYPYENWITSSVNGDYIVELRGTNTQDGVVLNTFTLSSSISSPPPAFVSGSRRLFVGAHRQDFTGSLLQRSDVKVGTARSWLTYLDNKTLLEHAQDIHNYGTPNPQWYAFPFHPSASFGEIPQLDTLVLNWNFNQNTGSNASGQFGVADFSSGSTQLATSQYDWLGPILLNQHPGRGDFFPANSIKAIDKDYITNTKQNLPENLQSKDMISVLSQEEQEAFGRTTRPVTFYFAFEKSPYQVISEEMINYFASMRDMHTLIGEPVNRYRIEYKALGKMRHAFFLNVENDRIDFDKFYEFYKWFDSSLSLMLQQLVPISADVAGNIRTIIESHIFERNKYQSKFPTIDTMDADIEGSFNTILNASPGWRYNHHPIDGAENKNAHWWKTRASREKTKLRTGNYELDWRRQRIFEDSDYEYEREIKVPYRFEARAGIQQLSPPHIIHSGPNYHPNKKYNYVFTATRPAGPLVEGTNLPANIMLAFDEDVERFVDVVDDLELTPKRRIGWGINARINKDLSGSATYEFAKGSLLAPFSLYSSSVTTGYNKQVVEKFTPGVMITNLHHDVYGVTHEVPLQGPFPETYVGGREHRHVPINKFDSSKTGPNNLDSPADRPEGFKILLGSCDGITTTSGALGIVDPQYPDPDSPAVSPPYLFDRPKGNMSRNVGTKRPVNIRNIRKNSPGNYSQNYDVVSTNARSSNDLFFRKQTFDFSLYPQSPYPRLPIVDRHAVQNIRVRNTKAISIDDSLNYYVFTAPAAMNTNKKETWSCWLNCTNPGELNYFILDVSDRYFVINADNTFTFAAYWTGPVDGIWQTDAAITTGNEWVHVAITYDGNSSTNHPVVYINGEAVAITRTSAEPTGDLEPYFGGIGIGYAGAHAFEGYISDLAFYNTNLLADEIKAIYGNSTLDLINYGPPRVASNLIMWWRMGDGPGDTVGTIIDQMGTVNLAAGGSPSIVNISAGDCLVTANENNFALPDRSGKNSNQTVFVNRFAGSGYEVMSRGYMDPAHEEKSVYNVLPYHNLSILNYGFPESASADPSIATAIVVVDQIGKNRGRNQRLTLHCGQFGHDAAYGTIPADTYVTVPSYQKTNRNPRSRIKQLADGSYVTGVVYDNGWVTHPIPRSARQYSWITASLSPDVGTELFGYSALSGGFAQSLPLISASQFGSVHWASGSTVLPRTLGYDQNIVGQGAVLFGAPVTASDFYPTTFAGINGNISEPVDISSHNLGYPLGTPLVPTDFSSKEPQYRNRSFCSVTNLASLAGAPVFNSLMLHRNGPYGWPTWKQIRAGQTPVARRLRKKNLVVVRNEPEPFTYVYPQYSSGGVTLPRNQVRVYPLKGNTFTSYIEQPISSRHKALEFVYNNHSRSAPGVDNNVIARVSWANNLDYFSNEGLNNRLNKIPNVTLNQPYKTLVNFTLDADKNNSDTLVQYTERIYPREVNAYQNRVRTRTDYSISDIWDDSRPLRSKDAGVVNSLGYPIYSASVWHLDAHNNFTTRPAYPEYINSVFVDSAGELQNDYCRFIKHTLQGSDQSQWARTSPAPAALYAMRIPMGSSSGGELPVGVVMPVWGGDTYWDAPEQAGKKPYQVYEEYAEFIRLKGKDHSLVPEFRISEHIEKYIEDGSDWLKDIDDSSPGMFEITGAAISDSAQTNFYKVYGHTDFLKYFKVIDDDLDNKNIGQGLSLNRRAIEIECSAYLKFLPYKGFYPAERTRELAKIFNDSCDDFVNKAGYPSPTYAAAVGSSCSLTPLTETQKILKRAIIEPLFAPGIVHNTVKSGIAVSSFVITNSASCPTIDLTASWLAKPFSILTELPEGNVDFGAGANGCLNPVEIQTGGGYEDQRGYKFRRIPFEAALRPGEYLSKYNIYDNGLPPSASLLDPAVIGAALTYNRLHVNWSGGGSDLYRLASDNYHCEVVNFFSPGLTSFVSAREDEFSAMQSGSLYAMTLRLGRPLNADLVPNRSLFEMYERASAFGPPFAGTADTILSWAVYSASFDPLTPPYFNGVGEVTILYQAKYDGKPELDDILSTSEFIYDRSRDNVPIVPPGFEPILTAGYIYGMQMDQSYNLVDKIIEVPPGTDSNRERWLIQSKFETPVLNFAGVSPLTITQPATGSVNPGVTPDVISKGMWHQYGSIPSGREAVVSSIKVPNSLVSPTFGALSASTPAGPEYHSLASVVGFDTTNSKQLGPLRTMQRMEEAIIAVPFTVKRNRRKFFHPRKRSSDYKEILKILDKYLLPPKLDFVTNEGLKPILFYAFEFGADLSQQDLADIWQNLPPDIGLNFESSKAIIREEKIIKEMYNSIDTLQWLVFKVKKKAAKDYNRFVKQNLTDDLDSVTPNIVSKYSYNWPYDYCSLVELIKLDATAQYETETEGTSEVDLLIRAHNPVIPPIEPPEMG